MFGRRTYGCCSMTRRATSFFVGSLDQELPVEAPRLCRTDKIQHEESARMRSPMILRAPRIDSDAWATVIKVATFLAAIACALEWGLAG